MICDDGIAEGFERYHKNFGDDQLDGILTVDP